MAVYGLTRRAQGVKPVVVVNPPRRRPRRRAQSKPIVVVPTTSNGRGRRRRGRRRSGGPRAMGSPGSGISRQQFVFSKDDIKGNSNGYITFGKDLSDHPAFSSGLLRAFHEYKITNVRIIFKSEAPSTAAGSIAYELDPHCELSTLSSKIFKFGVTKGGQKTWTAEKINGKEWHSSSENQFRFLWRGNGDNTQVGSFEIHYTCLFQGPK
ncbi:TPA_asm: P3 protein [Trachyspermum ammi polerovirus]|nr:TPA_asm: P3 protein [Trachyspermum ammi polerovirus]